MDESFPPRVMSRRRFLGCAALAFPPFLRGVQAQGGPFTTTAPSHFNWTPMAALPEPVGLKGMYAGCSGGRILVAGGSNFPIPRAQGGTKKFHRTIFVLNLAADERAGWTVAPAELPEAVGEGVAISTPRGVVCLGGMTTEGPSKRVFFLRWNEQKASVEVKPLPDLPVRFGHGAGTLIGNTLVLAAGDDGSGGSRRCWAQDLGQGAEAPISSAWKSLESCPGPLRVGPILQPIEVNGRIALLLAGGKEPDGDYLADAHLLFWDEKRWRQAAPMPHPALMAASLRILASEVAVLGGSDGHDRANMAALGEKYRLPDRIMTYQADRDAWSVSGAMPVGLAGASVVAMADGSWVIAGGEPSPSLRTPAVFRITKK